MGENSFKKYFFYEKSILVIYSLLWKSIIVRGVLKLKVCEFQVANTIPSFKYAEILPQS